MKMKSTKLSLLGIFSVFSILFCISCDSKKNVSDVPVTRGAFSSQEPYAIIIKKERSYYQAERIVNRLKDKSIESYILPKKDEDGDWYQIVTSALKDSAEVVQCAHILDSLHIKPLGAINFNATDSLSRIPVTQNKVSERKKIEANDPKLSSDLKSIISKFPANNMFYLQNMSVTELTPKAVEKSNGQKLDLPRGVKLNTLMKKGCTAMASVIYSDNLFGDNVTLQIVKCKPHSITAKAGFVPTPTENNQEALELCSAIADLILATGKYADEKKDGFKINAYKQLVGYKISFSEKGNTRNYYILTDTDGEMIYMTQSTKDSDVEIIELLQEIGKTDGLVSYEEFYNSFYLMSDNPVNGDIFLGYYLQRLTNQYAKERGYQKWAKRMVGHWDTEYWFYNPYKGFYTISVFDMLTGDNRRDVYNHLYMKKDNDIRKQKIKVYGAPGIAYYNIGFAPYIGIYTQLGEISMGYGPWIIAISGSDSYAESDLSARLEAMQMEQGGYTAYKERMKNEKNTKDKGKL